MVKTLFILGLQSIALVKPGDDLAKLIFGALASENVELVSGDVLVVSQKIVSKAEGLLVDISKIKPSAKALSLAKRTKKDARLIEVILRDSTEVLRADRLALVVRTKHGFVCLNSGIDKSNVDGAHVYTRLPRNPDASAERLRIDLEKLSGKELALIVADTYSRPFRAGQVEFAIGVSGMEPILDYRGGQDLFGYELKYKYVGLVDEIAAAAELVMGQGTESIPVAIVRGLTRVERSHGRALSKKLLLGKRLDLFGIPK